MIFVESNFAGASGLAVEVVPCRTPEDIFEAIRAAMARPDWSDSTLVDADALPEPARDSWKDRADVVAEGQRLLSRIEEKNGAT